jgi:hypothetical protein
MTQTSRAALGPLVEQPRIATTDSITQRGRASGGRGAGACSAQVARYMTTLVARIHTARRTTPLKPNVLIASLVVTIEYAAPSRSRGGAGSSAGRRPVAVAAILVGPTSDRAARTAGVEVVGWRAGIAEPAWVHRG